MAKKDYIGVENFVRRNLPEGYTQVAYIESTGTQYLNTRFCPSYNTRVVVEISDATTEDYIFGARDTDSTTAANQFGVYINANSKLRSDYFGTSVSDTPSNIAARTIVDKNANVTTAFGLTITNTAVASGAVSYPLWLFALNNVGAIKVPSSLKMWSALIYGNGIDLDRDYVTCIQDSTGIAGMYDMVTNTFEHSAGTEEFIAGPTYESIARKLKKGYVGVVTDVPIYETATVNITDSNITTMFVVSNGSYYFKGSGGTFTTTNGGVNSSTATTTLTALKDMDISFTYSYSSEADYDKFTLTVAGTTIESAVSGSTTTKTYSGSLAVGETIVFTYAKDTSQHKNDDKCAFSNMVCIATTQTGVETKPVARKIKKIYAGDENNIARLCYWSKVDDLNKLFSSMTVRAIEGHESSSADQIYMSAGSIGIVEYMFCITAGELSIHKVVRTDTKTISRTAIIDEAPSFYFYTSTPRYYFSYGDTTSPANRRGMTLAAVQFPGCDEAFVDACLSSLNVVCRGGSLSASTETKYLVSADAPNAILTISARDTSLSVYLSDYQKIAETPYWQDNSSVLYGTSRISIYDEKCTESELSIRYNSDAYDASIIMYE